MTAVLPTLTEAFESLSQHGYQFPSNNRRVVQLENVNYRDGNNRAHPAQVDTFALAGVSKVYAGLVVRNALTRQVGVQAQALVDVARLLNNTYSNEAQLVWGFSGYAMPGYPYGIEARGMRALFGCLHHFGQPPSLVADGGVSDGVLGLSGVLAKRFGVPSLGYIPKAGLAELGPRDHLVVHMDTYRQREQLVGTTPDILVCVGGHDGTRRECEAAAAAGSVILILALRQYRDDSFVATYSQSEAIGTAIDQQRLRICRSLGAIQAAARWAIQTASTQPSMDRRATRLRAISGLLAE